MFKTNLKINELQDRKNQYSKSDSHWIQASIVISTSLPILSVSSSSPQSLFGDNIGDVSFDKIVLFYVDMI